MRDLGNGALLDKFHINRLKVDLFLHHQVQPTYNNSESKVSMVAIVEVAFIIQRVKSNPYNSQMELLHCKYIHL